ncbi:MAG: hypothetical protein IKE00_04130 [Oscillospiraceae bacterium]|nr:hypothetical protein [Oscillospiraceae bacterium]
MYDSFLIRSDSLENFEENGKVAGFKFSVRIANYRGCFLGLHNGYYCEVDGVSYPREAQRLAVNGKPPRSFEELMKHAVLEHWDMQDEAFLYVYKEGGLEKGTHRVGILESILGAYGSSPRDEEYVKNPPDPSLGIGTGKTSVVCYYDLELQG